MVTLLVLAFLAAALIAYVVGIYNSLVRVGNEVKLAWSNIDVLLVQRHDELPKLIEVCRQYTVRAGHAGACDQGAQRR
jgi:LemA protein